MHRAVLVATLQAFGESMEGQRSTVDPFPGMSLPRGRLYSLRDFGHVLPLFGVSFLQWSPYGLARGHSPGVGHKDGSSLVPAFSGVEEEIVNRVTILDDWGGGKSLCQ